jgi:nicotinamidase-related amidase
MSTLKVELLIVDPQNDFCIADDSCGHKGSLVVSGGDKDMSRIAQMIRRLGSRLDDIHVTLDSHRPIDISHPTWWKRVSDGSHPAPFTVLGAHNGKVVVMDGATMTPTPEEFTTTLPSLLYQGGPTGKGSLGYLEALAARKRYPHVIWPEHCLIGSWGHNVVPELHEALCEWERANFATVDYVTKGSNPFTEHFSGVQAEVPDPKDPSTQVNVNLVGTMEQADIVAIAGEALSHCVAESVRGIAKNFRDSRYIGKLVLLTDASSNVTGFDSFGSNFIKEMTAKGMKLSTTDKFLV